MGLGARPSARMKHSLPAEEPCALAASSPAHRSRRVVALGMVVDGRSGGGGSGGSCPDVLTPSERPHRTVIRLGRGALPSGASPSSTRTSASSGSRSADAPVMLGSLQQQHSEHGARKIDG